jgi:cytochrome b561
MQWDAWRLFGRDRVSGGGIEGKQDPMRWRDTQDGYGWLSIALHWVTAIAVLGLWFVGANISGSGTERNGMVSLHTTIAVMSFALLVIRIVWRLRSGHPGRSARQGELSFAAGKLVHYVLLASLAVMLGSGPLMAWSAGSAIHVFALDIPSPWEPSPEAFSILHLVHSTTATVVVGLHVLGVFKHMIFDRDGTLDRIMAPSPAVRPDLEVARND